METFSCFCLDPLLQRFVEFAQRLLGLDLLRDIRVGAKQADDFASFIADGQCAREKPAVVSISTTKGECILPWRATFETAADTLNDRSDVVGMVHLLPAPPFH